MDYLSDDDLYYSKVEELDEARDLIKHLSIALDHCLRFSYSVNGEQRKHFLEMIKEAREFTGMIGVVEMDLIKFDLTEDEKKGLMSKGPRGMYEKWIHSYEDLLTRKTKEIKEAKELIDGLNRKLGMVKQELRRIKGCR